MEKQSSKVKNRMMFFKVIKALFKFNAFIFLFPSDISKRNNNCGVYLFQGKPHLVLVWSSKNAKIVTSPEMFSSSGQNQ